jgi:cysteinyl-tRNA synthetase
MHNEMLQVEGKKMSKSLGNFFTVRDLLDQGIPGEVIRFVFLSTHYGKPMDWTARKAEEAKERLIQWFRKTDGVEANRNVNSRVVAALADDLNTHLALSEMHHLPPAALKAAMRLLGFPDAEAVTWFREQEITAFGVSLSGEGDLRAASEILIPIIHSWQNLRNERLYAQADRIRDRLAEAGVKVSVGPEGPQAHIAEASRFDPSKLKDLE